MAGRDVWAEWCSFMLPVPILHDKQRRDAIGKVNESTFIRKRHKHNYSTEHVLYERGGEFGRRQKVSELRQSAFTYSGHKTGIQSLFLKDHVLNTNNHA